MDQSQAIARISSSLREDGSHYSFDDLEYRFESAYDEALEQGEPYVTIKIPSSHEASFSLAVVKAALGR